MTLANPPQIGYNLVYYKKRGGSGIFNIGFSELILVLLIAFLVVGPKDLPKVARWLGRMVRKMRLMIREVKKETGWDDLEKEYRDTRADVRETVSGLKKDLDVTAEMKDAAGDLTKSVKEVETELRQTGRQIGQEAEQLEEETIKREDIIMRLGTTEIILIVVLALVLFGGGKLAGVGKALGKSIKDFKNEVKDDGEKKTDDSEEKKA